MYTKTQIERTIKILESCRIACEHRVCDNEEESIYMYALAHALGVAMVALEEMPTREDRYAESNDN